MGFPNASFDVVLSGFIAWSDCFDFIQGGFTRPDKKSKEIWRVLKEGGRVVIAAWERQEDLHWMEDAFVRNFPALLEDKEYIEQRPIGMAKENMEGYRVILQSAGFSNIEVFNEQAEFVSATEEDWWEQMRVVGWDELFKKVNNDGTETLARIKNAIFRELQTYKHHDGIHFSKSVFIITGRKQVIVEKV